MGIGVDAGGAQELRELRRIGQRMPSGCGVTGADRS